MVLARRSWKDGRSAIEGRFWEGEVGDAVAVDIVVVVEGWYGWED